MVGPVQDFGSLILFILLLSPLLALLHILVCHNTYVRVVALSWAVFIFFCSLVLFAVFDKFLLGFQYGICIARFNELGVAVHYGVDGISMLLILLTTFLIPICILSSWESISVRLREFLALFFVVEFLLIHVFSVLDLFLFYVFFEGILIPMFLLVGVWGSRTRRVYAAYQFFIYTFLGSVFMLIAILFIANTVGTTSYLVLFHVDFPPTVQLFLWLGFFCSFVVKIPMFPVHIWLPEAHAEAPTAGSVILAGVLLKLGIYGLVRFSIPLFPCANRFFGPAVLTLAVIGVVYTSCTTLRQLDLKKAIAYSSVAHMGLVVGGLFSDSVIGLEGAVYLMLSHGLVSGGLFLCIGILYDRYGTRIIRYYGGLVSFMPVFILCFFILTLANMGLPGTSAFIGECLIFWGLWGTNTVVTALAVSGTVLSAGYAMWLYNRVAFGQASKYLYAYADLNQREISLLGFVVMLVVFFGISGASVLELVGLYFADLFIVLRFAGAVV